MSVFSRDFGCLLSAGYSLLCSFGGVATAASFNASAGVLQCSAPPGTPDTTVEFVLQVAGGGEFAQPVPLAEPTRLLFSYLSAPRLIAAHAASQAARVNSSSSQQCFECGAFNTQLCGRDCHGDYGGTAFLDSELRIVGACVVGICSAAICFDAFPLESRLLV